MDYIPGLTVPNQERRLRIVVLYVLFHKCRIRIGKLSFLRNMKNHE